MGTLRRDIWITPEGRQVVWMTLASWLLVLGVYQLTETLSGRFGWLYDIPMDVPAVVLVALLVLPAYPLVLALHEATPWQKWLIFFVVALVIASLQSMVNLGENRLLGVIPRFDAAHADLIRERFARVMQGHFYKTFANITLIAFTVQVRDRAADRMALLEVSARADRARLAALRLQLNPHFLFNTLNAISSLVGAARTREADEMIERLSDFLRQTLEEEVDAIVPLSQELAALDSYVAIERIRFGERLNIELNVDRTLRARILMPSLILQPLVENAIKYAVAPARQPVTIALSAWEEDGLAVIDVRDDGAGVAVDRGSITSTGLGLANVRQRLETLYGSAAALEAGPDASGGWRVRLRFPPAITSQA
jgi:sensor histidine kinase YesM